jgi:hypothetical protein
VSAVAAPTARQAASSAPSFLPDLDATWACSARHASASQVSNSTSRGIPSEQYNKGYCK